MYEVIALVLALVAIVLLRRAESRISRLENRVKDLEARPIAAAAAPVVAEAPELVETIETANVLATKERRGELSLPDVEDAWRDLLRAPLETTPVDTSSAREALSLAVALRHPAHDCCYLELALARRTAVVTADRRFRSLADRQPSLEPALVGDEMHVLAPDPLDRPGVRPDDPCERHQQRRLAHPVRPAQQQHAARLEREIEIGEQPSLAAPHAEAANAEMRVKGLGNGRRLVHGRHA